MTIFGRTKKARGEPQALRVMYEELGRKDGLLQPGSGPFVSINRRDDELRTIFGAHDEEAAMVWALYLQGVVDGRNAPPEEGAEWRAYRKRQEYLRGLAESGRFTVFRITIEPKDREPGGILHQQAPLP